jgi:hypothetical protein
MAERTTHEEFQPAAAVLAALVPGLGHAYLGEPRRGMLIAGGVLGMFLGGLVIGGIDVVDRKEDFWWFVGQSPVGPLAFAVDWVHQNRLKQHDPPAHAGKEWFEHNTPSRTKSLGHLNEIGSLYATIAGMMNLVCIIDAAWHAPRRRRGARA